MAATVFTRHIYTDYDTGLILAQWQIDQTDAAPPWLVIGPFSDIVAQLLTIDSGTPTVGIEGSLNRPDDGAIVAARLTDPTQTIIAFTAAGIKGVLEGPYMIRPRVTTGTGQATIRIKASKVYPGN